MGRLRAGEADHGEGKIVCVNDILGRIYVDTFYPAIQGDLKQILSQQGLQPEVERDTETGLSAFQFLGDGKLVVQFVNYEHKFDRDETKTFPASEFIIALPDALLDESFTATYYSPGEVEQDIEITLEGDVLHASLPEIDIWGVLLISVSGAS